MAEIPKLDEALKDPAIVANANAQILINEYAKYTKAQTDSANIRKFTDWLSNEGSAVVNKIFEDVKKVALGSVDDDKIKVANEAVTAAKNTATNVMKSKKLNGTFNKEGEFTPEQPSQLTKWLGDNWPMLAAIVVPIIAAVSGMFGDSGTMAAVLVGVGTVGVATYASDKDSILGQGREYFKKTFKIGQGKAPAAGAGTPAAGAGARTETPASTITPDPAAVLRAQAQADFEGLAGAKGTSVSLVSQTGYEVEIGVESKSDASVARNFKGTMDDAGTLTIDRITVIDKDGIRKDVKLSDADVVKIEKIGDQPDGSGSAIDDTKLMAARRKIDALVKNLGGGDKAKGGHGLPEDVKITTAVEKSL